MARLLCCSSRSRYPSHSRYHPPLGSWSLKVRVRALPQIRSLKRAPPAPAASYSEIKDGPMTMAMAMKMKGTAPCVCRLHLPHLYE
uniref:HDC19589 n=1 Tax=Drosophila melanogaster TaxID=7227 RepID=Q6II66_DROME|nr:TPA_inf: HDC19589 [Drosophila melanogaster]